MYGLKLPSLKTIKPSFYLYKNSKRLYSFIKLFTIVTCFIACTGQENFRTLDVQGHRGCRGLQPENTIKAFLKAVEIGVTTLEMDLVISKDKQVVVSHEPFFSHHISTMPNGEIITAENELKHNMYLLSYREISNYDVGLKPHPNFPDKQLIKAKKPLFKEVIKTVEQFVSQNNYKKPFYNVEIKRQPKYDSVYHPGVNEFVRLVVNEIKKTGIKERIVIQSFDIESLKLVKQLDPEIKLVLLIENQNSVEQNITILGFLPNIYSPNYKLVNQDLIDYCKSKNIKVIPWTVNSKTDMIKMIDLEVDGIITDFPNHLVTVLDSMNIKVQ